MGDIDLKEFIEARLTSTEERFHDFKEALNERLSKMNEIREQLTDQANRMATKESVQALDRRINTMIWFGIVSLASLVTSFIIMAVAIFLKA